MAPETLKQELDSYLAAHPETRYLEALVTDINGILRGKRAERDDFYKLFGNGMNLCAATAILDSRGNTFESVPYGVRDGDPDVKGVAIGGHPGARALGQPANRPGADRNAQLRRQPVPA